MQGNEEAVRLRSDVHLKFSTQGGHTSPGSVILTGLCGHTFRGSRQNFGDFDALLVRESQRSPHKIVALLLHRLLSPWMLLLDAQVGSKGRMYSLCRLHACLHELVK